jgi:hypothetical protein
MNCSEGSPVGDDLSLSRDTNAVTPGMPFFADVVMDLSVAHDLAETPEASRPLFVPFTSDISPSRRNERIALPYLDTTVLEDDASDTPSPRRRQTFHRISNLEADFRTRDLPKTLPRWPRDISWTVTFLLFVPFSLLWPILKKNNPSSSSQSSLSIHPLSTATIHALVWAAVATVVLSRALYRTAGGGDGDDARHSIAAALVRDSAPLAVLVHGALTVAVAVACPEARVAALVPLACLLRDVEWLRRGRRPSQVGTASGSRQAFAQALVAMALDILSRSLRRASFYRVLVATLLVQWGVLLLWRWALLAALDQLSISVLLVTLVGLKWVTGTISRVLTLLASGGVMTWFAEQSRMLAQDMPSTFEGGSSTNDGTSEQLGHDVNITEAYRTVDASVYASVAEMDDILDDDAYQDGEELLEAPTGRERARTREQESSASSHHSTVKSMLYAGLTVSFGSVAQCGLLGGLAHFLWSQVRMVEYRGGNGHHDGTGFQGMQIGSENATILAKLWAHVNSMTRGFVKRYSDLGMCHVAAYHKSYQRAARDVAVLIEESGTYTSDSCTFLVFRTPIAYTDAVPFLAAISC